MDYIPDRWVVVKLAKEDKSVYKILGGWLGGYLDGDSWRLNSGISKVEKEGDTFKFHGYSGSIYICRERSYGTTMLSNSIATLLAKQGAVVLTKSEALDIDWDKELGDE
jgi:hypothetical protein